MDKRRLAYTLLLVGVLFVALLHTVIATFLYDTGLSQVGLLVAGLCVFGILMVNFGMPRPERGDEPADDGTPGGIDRE